MDSCLCHLEWSGEYLSCKETAVITPVNDATNYGGTIPAYWASEEIGVLAEEMVWVHPVVW